MGEVKDLDNIDDPMMDEDEEEEEEEEEDEMRHI